MMYIRKFRVKKGAKVCPKHTKEDLQGGNILNPDHQILSTMTICRNINPQVGATKFVCKAFLCSVICTFQIFCILQFTKLC